MNRRTGNLFLEMALIILVSSVIGLIWNHTMLYSVWSGKSVAAPSLPVSGDTVALPVPAGLAQVKYLYDHKQAVLVDARDELTFGGGRIKGAVSMPVGKLDANLPEFKTKVPVTDTLVVYCSGYGCHDSMTVAKKLMTNGYSKVLVFEGGYPEWKDAGYPVEGEHQ